MADQKISAMTAATTLGDADELLLASAGASKKITGANLKASMGGSAGAMTLLSTTTLASPGIFDVSGISGVYNDLVLVSIVRGADATGIDRLLLRLNNDTAANYESNRLNINGSTATPVDQITATSIQFGHIPTSGGAVANFFGYAEACLYGYASTSWIKTVRWESGMASAMTTSGVTINNGGGVWNSTAAITRIQLFGSTTANLVAGSQLRIYGRL